MTSVPTDRMVAPALADVTQALTSGESLAAVLRIIVHHCDVLLGADETAVILAQPDGTTEVMASSSTDPRIVQLHELCGSNGPSLRVIETGKAVFNEDVTTYAHGWIEFARTAGDLGFRSVHVFPMTTDDATIGAIPILSRETAFLTIHDAVAAQTLADFATIAVLSRPDTPDAETLRVKFQSKINERVEIGQAIGVLMHTREITADTAYETLLDLAAEAGISVRQAAKEMLVSRGEHEETLHLP